MRGKHFVEINSVKNTEFVWKPSKIVIQFGGGGSPLAKKSLYLKLKGTIG